MLISSSGIGVGTETDREDVFDRSFLTLVQASSNVDARTGIDVNITMRPSSRVAYSIKSLKLPSLCEHLSCLEEHLVTHE